MFLVLPIGAEASVRRYPVVTLGLMASLLLLHLGLYPTVIRQQEQRAALEVRLQSLTQRLMLEATRSEGGSRDELPDLGGDLGQAMRNLQAFAEKEQADFVARMRDGTAMVSAEDLEEWRELDRRLQAMQGSGVYERFGYAPARGWSLGLLTHMFLHGGWMHLLGNLAFFYVVGCLVEDLWGRPFFLALYLVGGVVAAWTHALMHPASETLLIGASGAIAAVMGAFAVRHARTPVRLWYGVLLFVIVRTGTIVLPGMVPLGLWFGWNLFQGMMFKDMPEMTNVAFWAHIGGFVFGFAVAWGVRLLRVEEHLLEPALEREASRRIFQQDDRIVVGTGLLGAGRLEEAERVFREVLERKPGDPLASRHLAGLLIRQDRSEEAAPYMARTLVDDLDMDALEVAAEDLGTLLAAAPGSRLPPRLLLTLGQRLAAGHPQAALAALRALAGDESAGALRLKGALLLASRLETQPRGKVEARELYRQLLDARAEESWRQVAREGLARLGDSSSDGESANHEPPGRQ